MRTQFMSLLNDLAVLDVENSPNYKTRIRLRDALLKKGLSANLAYDLAGQMVVEVSESAYADTELMDRAIEVVTDLAMKMYALFIRDFTTEAFKSRFSSVKLEMAF